jgi:hypothetical protein
MSKKQQIDNTIDMDSSSSGSDEEVPLHPIQPATKKQKSERKVSKKF